MASRPLAASPTISSRFCFCRQDLIPSKTKGCSSTSRTLIFDFSSDLMISRNGARWVLGSNRTVLGGSPDLLMVRYTRVATCLEHALCRFVLRLKSLPIDVEVRRAAHGLPEWDRSDEFSEHTGTTF